MDGGGGLVNWADHCINIGGITCLPMTAVVRCGKTNNLI